MQTIPSIFIEKNEIDKTVDRFKKSVVVSFEQASGAIHLQRELRRKCQIALAMHKVDPIGPGSPTLMAA